MESDSKSTNKQEIYYLKNYRYLKSGRYKKKSLNKIDRLDRQAYSTSGGYVVLGAKNDNLKHKEMKDYIYEKCDEEEKVLNAKKDMTITNALRKVMKAVNMVCLADNESGYILKRLFIDKDFAKRDTICDELYITTNKYSKLKKNALLLYSKYYNNI